MTDDASRDVTFDAFAAGLSAGRPQVLVRLVIDDLETPVSAYLKIGHGRPYAFLFESVEGGAVNGRYSIITREPDVVWRCRNGKAEIARGADVLSETFTPEDRPALESLRALIAATERNDIGTASRLIAAGTSAELRDAAQKHETDLSASTMAGAPHRYARQPSSDLKSLSMASVTRPARKSLLAGPVATTMCTLMLGYWTANAFRRSPSYRSSWLRTPKYR